MSDEKRKVFPYNRQNLKEVDNFIEMIPSL